MASSPGMLKLSMILWELCSNILGVIRSVREKVVVKRYEGGKKDGQKESMKSYKPGQLFTHEKHRSVILVLETIARLRILTIVFGASRIEASLVT